MPHFGPPATPGGATPRRTRASATRPLAGRGLVAASILLCLPSCAPARRSSDRGPVVVYLVDALRPDRMSAYGFPLPTTPAAADLAREGVAFTNAFAVSTWTRPSIATLLTSRLPSETATLNRWGILDDSVWYLPRAFREKGWTTAAFVSNGNLFDDRLGFQRGWDVFRPVVHAPDGSWHPTAREVVDPVLEFVRSRESPRFLLYVHVVDPHAPYILEPGYRHRFARGAASEDSIPLDYDRSVRQADDQFGRMAGALRGKGFWDSATIVYTADHGEEFLEHGASSHGHALYEEQLRVPLLVKYPGGEDGGSRRPDPVTLADVTPTLAALHGLPAQDEWIGTSLWRRSLPPERELYFTEDLDDNRLYGLRRGRRKLVVRLYPTFSRTLYELDRDPGEREGLSLPCRTTQEVAPTLFPALRTWRQRDVLGFPALLLEAGPPAARCETVVDLSGVSKPFLTAEDYCRWSSEIDDGRLTFRGDGSSPEGLRISADDHGRPASVDTPWGTASCSVQQLGRALLPGPRSEEHLEQLRALGYLQDP